MHRKHQPVQLRCGQGRACIHTYIHTYIHTCIYAQEASASPTTVPPQEVCIHTYMHTYTHAYIGSISQSNYSAAKAGLASDTAVWARELARHNIRVGAIAPGAVQVCMYVCINVCKYA
jgi:NAD(P)-dependent dehydrogenase (short-subunit alcohol dehydrogenase family)